MDLCRCWFARMVEGSVFCGNLCDQLLQTNDNTFGFVFTSCHHVFAMDRMLAHFFKLK